MPLARHDRDELDYFSNIPDFYSHASCEAWHTSICHLSVAVRFLLTCLLRGMTILIRCLKRTGKISTHMPLARHDKELWQFVKVLEISTHMPLARHDWRIYCGGLGQMISTHMPLARHDVRTIIIVAASMEFLLTCLLRGMTNPNLTAVRVCGYFYSHASCEAWHLWTRYDRRGKEFLLTCLLRGMTCRIRNHYRTSGFLLTCLLRGMTIESELRFCTFGHFYSHASCEAWLCAAVCRCWITAISTHMPLARHDYCACICASLSIYFYSHASCEAWRNFTRTTALDSQFLLTCLLRGMTIPTLLTLRLRWHFYSHASCEAWQVRHGRKQTCIYFYSHASCEAWPHRRCGALSCARDFYSHASCEAWRWDDECQRVYCDFYSHASCEAWLHSVRKLYIRLNFYSHASCEAWLLAASVAFPPFFISTHMPLARHDRYILHSNRIFTPHIETDIFFLLFYIIFRWKTTLFSGEPSWFFYNT